MGFDLSNYETVDTRINKFYDKWPNGRIITELIAYSDQAFIVKAFVYRDQSDQHASTTGFAEEKVGSNPVNRTSALENCETSAIGRALANLNFAPKGLRVSREEMNKIVRYETANGDVPKEEWKNTARGAWADVGTASEKQVTFVKSIVKDAFISTGFKDDAKAWNIIGEWVKSGLPITQAEDLTSKQASMIINDKMKTTKGTTKLVEFLQAKQPSEHDPWASSESVKF